VVETITPFDAAGGGGSEDLLVLVPAFLGLIRDADLRTLL
jgi:hypothetical protein